ncbi:tRNA-intron lyase [Halomicrobium katesii]|uniref:tRNA-intron lyase n=1 Tax=Halomicrobium katesii TaxID=437163 RepID=UPI000363CC4E|nr:tRNA-intron lyase [Halomicrobium katesii]
MDATLSDGVVRAGKRAREQFYDSSGYGRPVDAGKLELAPVEAAHLLYRGDLDGVDGMGLRELLNSALLSEVDFFVYKDLRDRGFYCSPARSERVTDPDGCDFVVYPRGKGPWDDAVAHRIRVVSERETVPAADLGACALAVVDEESEISYFETHRPDVTGTSRSSVPDTDGDLLADRVVCWDPPEELYEAAFYGQPLDEQDAQAIQLSLVEAAYLAGAGTLHVEGDADAVIERGRAVEGDRFDRRLAVYERLREQGIALKTGFKFGADFRTYAAVESVADLGHSELLVRAFDAGHVFEPRDLALDVRLAHGVRKTMAYAFVGGEGIDWLAVERLTP